MLAYDGSQGYGRIGDFKITAQTKLSVIVREISPSLMNLMKKHTKATGTKFNPWRYVTKDHGQLEIIYDDNGEQYGFDHGSYASWGFKKAQK